jgi:hypothetical protein
MIFISTVYAPLGTVSTKACMVNMLIPSFAWKCTRTPLRLHPPLNGPFTIPQPRALPLLHALVVNALMLLKGNPFAYTRLPRCAARARQHRYRKACYQYQSQMLIRCFFFYLIMFYMGGDPSSGRRSIYSTSYVNSSNTRFRKRFFRVPTPMNKIGRYCDLTLNTLLLTHTKHQDSMSIYDQSK